jgi:type VI secretion system secreted protein VgrG
MAEVSQESQAGGEGQDFKVEVRFEAYPTQGTPYFRPLLTQSKPHIYGPHSARVVGPAGVPIFTDSYGRVKVQFHWDRYGKRDANSSCWVRVASPFSGNQMGMMNLPRIGQEVLIEFIGGDPDLPVCTAQVHNQFNMPAWRLPEQLALSGFRSRELLPSDGNSAGSRSNHLILDDTNGQIQTQLKSDHDHSQLSLGHITRVEDVLGRKDFRGQGFELRTDGHGAIRSEKGLLITTQAREQAANHITDMAETTDRLDEAQDLHETYAKVAQICKAQIVDDDQKAIAGLIKKQNKQIKGDGPLKEFTTPHMVLSSPVGIATTTPLTTHISSGEDIALTSHKNLSFVSGKNWFASVAERISLFVHKAGMKLFASEGKIEIQAQHSNVEILAQKVIELLSDEDWVRITGKKGVMITGGGSYIKLTADGIEHGTQGNWTAYAADHAMPGPRSAPMPHFEAKKVCVECLMKAAKKGSALVTF